jgi:hypothetical protein
MVEIFNKKARCLARGLGIEFPEKKFREVMQYLESLKLKNQ